MCCCSLLNCAWGSSIALPVITILSFISLREYFVLREGIHIDPPKARSAANGGPYRVVITGSTSGLGFEAALRWVEIGAHVVVHGPDPNRTHGAANFIQTRARSGGKVIPIYADMDKNDEVRRMSKQVISSLGTVEFIYLNAGFLYAAYSPTMYKQIAELKKKNASFFVSSRGTDKVMSVNHFGPFLLMMTLKDNLAPGARIMFSFGKAGWHGRADRVLARPRFQWELHRTEAQDAYADSKLAMTCYSRSLRAVLGSKAHVYMIDPGLVATTMGTGRGAPNYLKRGWRHIRDERLIFWMAPGFIAGPLMLQSAFIKPEYITDSVAWFFFPPTQIMSLIMPIHQFKWKAWHHKVPTWLLKFQKLSFGKLHQSDGPTCAEPLQRQVWEMSEQVLQQSWWR